MKQNTITVRISTLNKHILSTYISDLIKDKNPCIEVVSLDSAITYLIKHKTKIFYEKIKSDAQNELNKSTNNRRRGKSHA